MQNYDSENLQINLNEPSKYFRGNSTSIKDDPYKFLALKSRTKKLEAVIVK